MVQAASCPVSIKLRAGYDNTSLFIENIMAAAESGVAFITLHPRTKAQRYEGKADWDLIARAKEHLSIPLVGNGDLLSSGDVCQMLRQTKCDGIMIGRGAAMQPSIFHAVRADFSGVIFQKQWPMLEIFLNTYRVALQHTGSSLQINKCKQMMHYLLHHHASLQEQKKELLRVKGGDAFKLFQRLHLLLQQKHML